MTNPTIFGFEHLLFLILLGLTPSLIWLWYYLKKDDHPEPKKMLLAVFTLGFLSVFFAFGLEWAFMKAVVDMNIICPSCETATMELFDTLDASALGMLISFFILTSLSFIEEFVKYAAAKFKIARSRFFDEPVDAMIYLIVAALGFAAAENIGYIIQNADKAVNIAYFRFLSATFLHVLASAIVGYFYALSLVFQRRHFAHVYVGLILATLLHAVFNFLIITSEETGYGGLLIILLMLGMFFAVSFLFERIKKLTFSRSKES